jgi:hypothetical protein
MHPNDGRVVSNFIVQQQFPANPLLSEKQAVRKVLDLMCGEQDPRDMILI